MITKNRLLVIFGIIIIILPFLGFPSSYKNFFTIVAGVIVTFIAALAVRHDHHPVQKSQNEVFTEAYAEKRPVMPKSMMNDEEDVDYTDIEAIRRESEKYNS